MLNDHEYPRLRRAQQITKDDLIQATATSARRALKEHESRAQGGPLETTIVEIIIGLILGDG